MNAHDIMTTDVLSVTPGAGVRDIALLLLRNGISAVPVVDGAGVPIGMVSEGDLIGRKDAERQARRDWWLTLFAEGEALHPDFLATVQASPQTAADVMSSPIVTVDENTPVAEIARILSDHGFKRVPVLREGRMVGIVSRADLVRAMASENQGAAAAAHASRAPREPTPVPRHDKPDATPAPDRGPPSAAPGAQADALTARHFRHLAEDFKEMQLRQRQESRLADTTKRRQRMRALLDEHISNEGWRTLLQHAHQAAERGQTEFLLLRFPSQLCSDGGRAINVAEKGWPKTLRGEAAEIYLWWEQDLKPEGFHLSARVLDFPGGMPGDIGLFVAWGE
jgi:CBS domain-containing protein